MTPPAFTVDVRRPTNVGAIIAGLIAFGTAFAAPLRFAATEMPRPDPCMPFITETSAWLQKHWPDGVTFRYYTVSEMERAVQNREVDIVLTEAGIAAMLRRDGARPMLTTVSRRHPNPERSQGSVVFVRSNRTDLKTWQDLRHTKLAAASIHDFTGFQAAMGELLHRGYEPAKFFSEVDMFGNTSKIAQQSVVEKVINGEADVGIVRTCFLEDLAGLRNAELPVRVIEPYEDPSFACLRSTALYPNWTISSVPTLSAEELRRVMELLFEMPPTSNGMFWSVAPSFSATDNLMKELKIGPYEFLRHWTIERLWQEYRLPICLLLFALVGLIVHMWRTEKLVARRTKELTDAFRREDELKTRARDKEIELEHYQRATIAGQISNMFAHEIKQPLHSAACYSHGLLRMLDQGRMNPEQFRRAIERIEEETAIAGRIVDKVRDYARGRRGSDEFVDLKAELEAVLEHESTRRGVAMTFTSEGGDAVIKADPLEVRLIFINLLKNAAEAAVAGTEPPLVTMHLQTEEGICIVTVRDTGLAVSEEVMKKLSVPLTTTKAEGLGFGLVIVRGLLAQMRGTLELKRQPSGGLEAVVVIPAVTPEHSAED